jgi:hypothetical protein
MDPIKLATPAQVERIKGDVDSGTVGAVLAMGEDLAVVKQVTELDPVFFDAGSSTSRRLMFIWGIENWLRLNNTAHYYFNVLADEENSAWRKVVETHGAKPRSKAPEIRYGKELINVNPATDK